MLPEDAAKLLEMAGLKPVFADRDMGRDWIATPKFHIIFIARDLDEGGLRRVAECAFLAAASHSPGSLSAS